MHADEAAERKDAEKKEGRRGVPSIVCISFAFSAFLCAFALIDFFQFLNLSAFIGVYRWLQGSVVLFT